jgi:hypothetical protein
MGGQTMIEKGYIVKFEGLRGEMIEGVVTDLCSHDRVKIECKVGTRKGTWVIPKKDVLEVVSCL